MDRSATRKRQVEIIAQQQVLLSDAPDRCSLAAHAFACSYIAGRVWARNDSGEL
ncbi:MAG: hypothetical protein ACLP50_38355 [Solirubrobacteraceae bacterium]